jgi:hypothetical protein
MSKRERMLALGIGIVVVLGGAVFLFYNAFWTPLHELDASILVLQQEVEHKEENVHRIEAAKAKLERWKQLSLPSDGAFSRREYEIYLSDLLRGSGFTSVNIGPKAPELSSAVLPNKARVYTRLPFTVVARANLASLADMLEGFYRTSLLHQIKHLAISRPSTMGTQLQQSSDLDIRMTVEALIVAGADNRTYLLPGLIGYRRLGALDTMAALLQAPTGLGLTIWAVGPTGPHGPGLLAQPPRQYASIAKKNIFQGSPVITAEVVEVAQFVHLTDITHTTERPIEAFFYDRYNNRTTRLRAETGFDTFRILDNDGETLVRGKVVRLDGREMVFQVEESYYSMHVGQSLDAVLKHSLTGEQLKVLGLGAVAEKDSNGTKVSGEN